MRAPFVCLIAGVALLAASAVAEGVAPRAVQTDEQAVEIDQNKVVEPIADPEDTATPDPTPSPTPTVGPVVTETPPDGALTAPPPPPSKANNAKRLTQEARSYEAKNRCMQSPSKMLGRAGSSDLPPPAGRFWDSLLFYLLAALCAGIIVMAIAIRHYRAEDKREPVRLLEVSATVIGIVAALVGLATQFLPRLQQRIPPPPSAELTVRAVDTRITRNELAATIGAEPPRRKLDGREVGNVIWVEMHLIGHRGKTLKLAWGSYENERTGPLVATTKESLDVPVTGGGDEQFVFQPIWVGYPGVKRYHVRFMLLDDAGNVQELARTEGMNGDLARFACA